MNQSTASVRCLECGKDITYKGTTSGLVKHLKSKHGAQYIQTMRKTQRDKGLTLTQEDNTQSTEMLLAKAFCTGLIPFRFAENKEFRLFCKKLNSNFHLPSQKVMKNLIVQNHAEYIQKLTHALKDVEKYVIITDGYCDLRGLKCNLDNCVGSVTDGAAVLRSFANAHFIRITTADATARISFLRNFQK
ncbi:unnamed protein product [Caenorhabditis bovis]|uniref:BED-type domain-containing protein n=1 Tax=Caenorhabditis bovis TaxID=2654633 RepID=A0A8S1F8E2_9PELO|nr:unnamed protein product [Caenorhabditis bovis]